MDSLTEAFFTIDKDHTDQITMDALEQYRLDNDLDESFINQWKKLFDPNNTGVITLQTFCDVLGLELAEVQEGREKFTAAALPPTVPQGILQIAEDMDLQRRIEIFELVKEAEEKNGNCERDIVKWLKLLLDEKYGRAWHVFVIRGQYYAYYSYEAGNSYCFKKDKRIYVVFKTPV
ncbi:hypothetical protein AAHC03_01172 [Spirometra sp. Aus1]